MLRWTTPTSSGVRNPGKRKECSRANFLRARAKSAADPETTIPRIVIWTSWRSVPRLIARMAGALLVGTGPPSSSTWSSTASSKGSRGPATSSRRTPAHSVLADDRDRTEAFERVAIAEPAADPHCRLLPGLHRTEARERRLLIE